MKKVSLRPHALQRCIESYQRCLLVQVRYAQKGEENNLKKISRNRLVLRQPSFPFFKDSPSNKQNEQPRTSSACLKREKIQLKVHSKNLSFFKHKPSKLQHNKLKLLLTQNLSVQTSEHNKMKELNNKKGIMIREKKLTPVRKCASAELKKEMQDSRHLIPQKIRQIRRLNHLKKSRQLKDEKQVKHISILIQAQRLAYQARKNSESKEKSESQPFISLQDFLNEWKAVNIH